MSRATAATDRSRVGIYALDQDPRVTATLGMYRYLRRLIAALDALPPPDDLAVTVWVSSEASEFFPRAGDCRWLRIETVAGNFATGIARLAADHGLARRLARRVDVMHFPKGWLPVPAPRTARLVATLPDAIPDYYARHYPAYVTRKMRYFRFLARHTLRRADRVITISETSAAALRALREPQHPPVVIPAGGLDAAELAAAPPERGRGLLVLGSPHPHKRTDETLAFLNRYGAARGERMTVTVTGLDASRQAELARLDRLECRCVGRLPDEALTAALRLSACLVYLSEVEGFGLPLLEAYEQGTPVCYRNTSAMAEVMRGAPGGWDGASFESFRRALDEALAMEPARVTAVREALARRFNWPDIARRTLDVYREVAAEAAREQVRVLNTSINLVTYASVLQRLRAWRKAGNAGGARSVVAANVHVVTEGAMYAAYAAALRDAALVLPDGMPLVWATRLRGGRLRDRCYGPELMARALAAFESDGTRHYFYGSTANTLDRLRAAVARRWPALTVAGTLAAPFGDFDDAVEARNIERINEARPDFVWLALGCPKQERWMHRYRGQLRATAVLGVGAAFDFIAGTVPQAPPALQRLGLEWAFRLAVEPRRLWKRYLVRNPYFLFQFLLQLLGLRWRAGPAPD